MTHNNKLGFTLAELLVALGILGVIATFTIPKVLQANQNSQYNAAAKEAASIISQAYQAYQTQNAVSANLRFNDMTQFINYIKFDNSAALVVDGKQTLSSVACNLNSGNGGCLVLANGGVLVYNGTTFGAPTSLNALEIGFDPNGAYSNTSNGPDKAVGFFLYYDGRITTRGTTLPNTQANGSTISTPNTIYDPPWFHWD
jgi:prepilin-type N-terminal cleavage/methylation domain-containing protein